MIHLKRKVAASVVGELLCQSGHNPLPLSKIIWWNPPLCQVKTKTVSSITVHQQGLLFLWYSKDGQPMDPHWSLACVRAPPILHHIWYNVNTDVLFFLINTKETLWGGGRLCSCKCTQDLGQALCECCKSTRKLLAVFAIVGFLQQIC